MSKSVRGVFGLMAALLLAAVVAVGCGGDDKGTGPGKGNDPRLVLGDGWAWVSDDFGFRTAIVFNSDGNGRNYMEHVPGTWDGNALGAAFTWYTIGGTLYMASADDDGSISISYEGSATYTVSGNTLKLVHGGAMEGMTVNYTKTQFDTNGGDGNGDEVNRDPRLILDNGWAWVNTMVFGIRGATVFKSDGTVDIYYDLLGTGIWAGPEAGTWYTIGNKLYVINMEEDDDGSVYPDTSSGNFAVSGNIMTWTDDEDGEVITFTKTQVDFSGTGEENVDLLLIDRTWIDMETGAMWDFYFDGGTAMATYIDMESFDVGLYVWSVSGSNIILTPIDFLSGNLGEPITYAYSVAGDVLTINGKTYTAIDLDDMLKGKISKAKASKMPKTALFSAKKR